MPNTTTDKYTHSISSRLSSNFLPIIIRLSVPTQTMTPYWFPSGYSRCYCLLHPHPLKKQFLDRKGGSLIVYNLLGSSSQLEGDANQEHSCLWHLLATLHLHLTSRPSKSWPITTSPSGELWVLHCPIFLPRFQIESNKDADWKNKSDKSNRYLYEWKDNTTPLDAKGNGRSPAIVSVEGIERSRQPARANL